MYARSTIKSLEISSKLRVCDRRSQRVSSDALRNSISSPEDAASQQQVPEPTSSSNLVNPLTEQELDRESGIRLFTWALKNIDLRLLKSRDLVIKFLIRTNWFSMYWKTLEELKNCGISIIPEAFAVLIQGYAEMNMIEKAVESFGRMKEFECKPNVYTYNALLRIILHKELFALVLALYSQMLKSNCSPNTSTYSILIHGCCESGRIEEALNLFDEMTHGNIPPNKIIYNIVLAGLCREKKLDVAQSIFNSMKEKGFDPDLISYNALLHGYCKLGRFDEAFAILRSLEEDGFTLEVGGYSSLIDGLFKARRFAEALVWYNKLLKKGVLPDVILYTIMIRGLSQQGGVSDAVKLLSEMTERGLVPDTYCYNAIIKGFCDMGLLDRAQSLKLEMLKKGQFPNACTYTILIYGLCKNGRVGEAQEIFDEMERMGCSPSVVTFNVLLDGLCRAGQLNEAQLLVCRMEVGRNPSLSLMLSQVRVLDSTNLQEMLEKMCEAGAYLRAYKLLRHLADEPDVMTYNILMNGFCKAGNIEDAIKLFKVLQHKGLSPDSVTYGTLINGLQRVDDEKGALAIYDHWLNNGHTPIYAVLKSLMTWFCRKRNVSLAFSLLLKHQRGLPGRSEKEFEIVEEHFKNGEIGKAIQSLIKMDLKFKHFDLAPYTILIIGLCQEKKVQEALVIFSVLDEYNFKVPPKSCVQLINTLCKQQKLDEAIDVFCYTLEKGFVLMPHICNKILQSLLVSPDSKDHSLDLVSRMKSFGYDLDVYLYQTTKSLLKFRC